MLLVFASFFLRNNIFCVKPASQSPFPPGYDFIIFKGTQPRGIPENCQAAEFRRHGDGAESQLPLSQVFRNKGAPQALFFRSPRVACILPTSQPEVPRTSTTIDSQGWLCMLGKLTSNNV